MYQHAKYVHDSPVQTIDFLKNMANELNNKIKLKRKAKKTPKPTVQIMSNIKFFPFLYKNPFHSVRTKPHSTVFSSWLENKRMKFTCSENRQWSYTLFSWSLVLCVVT